MNLSTRRQRIEELDALLEGRLAPEDASAETARLLSVATAVLERDPLPAVELGAERKAAMRQQLLADIAALPVPVAERVREGLGDRVRRTANQARVAVASTMAASMVGTTGVAVAAQQALPGDGLYGVKKATESLRLSLAGDAVATGRLELRFAEERLEEVVEGARDGRVDPEHLIGALLEMDERSLTGAEQLVAVAERDGRADLLEEVAAFTDRQASTLAAAYADLPVAVKPHAEDSLGVLRRIRIELLVPAMERCDCVELAGAATDLPDGDATPSLRGASLPLPPLDLDTVRDAFVVTADRGEGTGTDDGTAGDAVSTPRATLDEAADATGTPGSTGRVGSAVERTTEAVGGTVRDTADTAREVVRDTASTTEKVVEDTSSTVGKVVEDTKDAVGKVTEGDVGGAVGGVVGGTTGTVGKVVEDTTGTVGKVVEDTTRTLDGLLGR